MATVAGSPQVRSWVVVAAFAALAVLRGCDGASSPDDPLPGGPARAALLASVGAAVVLPAVEAFAAEAAALQEAVDAWDAALAADGDGATARATAQGAFLGAMGRWQVVEVLQFGPTASSLSALGGADLRDAIYSWPTSLPCRVDQEIVEAAWGTEGWVDAELPNVLGLDALEYLLFREDAGNGCPPIAAINEGDWQALDPDEIDRRRAAYAAVLAAAVAATADALVDAWAPGGGDFGAELAAAGQGSTLFPSEQDALDELFEALFYVELVTKDRKLARPLGLRDCFDPTCPLDLELRWSDGGRDAIAANVEGFRLLFGGGGGDGFDDLLRAIDQDALVDGIEGALLGVDAALDALPAGLADTLAEEPDALLALHDALKDLTDRLKGDFALLLSLQIPTDAAGDND